jgi:hypothetical protein
MLLNASYVRHGCCDHVKASLIREPVIGPIHKRQAHIGALHVVDQSERHSHVDIGVSSPL